MPKSRVEEFIFQFGEQVVAALEKSLPRKTDATGNLRATMHFTVKRFGINYTFELYLADYWKWVDQGRSPGKRPPLDAIIQWIKFKGLATKKKGYESRLSALSKSNQLRNMSFAIAGKIASEGTKGTKFYSSVIPGLVNDFRKELPRKLAEDLKIQITEALK